jgi:hypothetical protein
MVVVSATPHVRARWSFGRPQGLRALATLALCIAVTLVTLPAVQTLSGASGPLAPTFGPVPQFLLGFWAAGAGLILLLQAVRSARADAGAHAGWVLVTLAAGFAILGLIPLRVVLAEGRSGGDMAAWMIGLANAFVGLAVLLFGIDAARPRRAGRHAGLPLRVRVARAPVTSGHARSAAEPLISGVDIVGAGTPAQAVPFGYAHHAWLNPTPRLGRPASIVLSAVPRRMLYAPTVSLPFRVFAALLALPLVIFLVINLSKLPKHKFDFIELLRRVLH